MRIFPEVARIWDSIPHSVLSELATLLRGKARVMYEAHRQRLANLVLMTSGIGCGYGDFVAEIVDDLKEGCSSVNPGRRHVNPP
jgi:hypothetical protein